MRLWDEQHSARKAMGVFSCVVVLLLVGMVHGQPRQALLQRTPAELIRSNGYPSEVHHATTPDGYVLQLDRIPRPGRPAVYLANQLLCSAGSYLLFGKGKSIGFLLYDAGFDVWLGNFRGTDFSLNHTTLSSSDDKFWEFGWDENGAIDNPAMIDYVLQTSGQRDLVYLGHSMGATTFFVMASERPDMLGKVRAAFLMAPVVFLEHHKSRLTAFYQPLTNITQILVERLHQHKSPALALRKMTQVFCGIRLLQRICARLFFRNGDEYTILPELANFMPAQGSLNQMLHYLQLANRKWPGFRRFNFGADENRVRYGTASPPDYKLSNITTPLYLYTGKADVVCTAQDLARLVSVLPNVKKNFMPRNPRFRHSDFVLSDTAATDVWQEVLSDLEPFRRR